MGLFKTLFKENSNHEEKIQENSQNSKSTNYDELSLNQESSKKMFSPFVHSRKDTLTEEYYSSLSCNQKIKAVYDYLEVKCKNVTEKKIIRKFAVLIVLFLIDSKGFSFSGYDNAISIKNPFIKFLITSKNKNLSINDLITIVRESQINSDQPITKRKKESIDSIDCLTSYEENKDLFLIERAIISIFSEGELPDFYHVENNTDSDKNIEKPNLLLLNESGESKELFKFSLCKKPLLLIKCSDSEEKKSIISNIVCELLLNDKKQSCIKLIIADFYNAYFDSEMKDIPILLWPVLDDENLIDNMIDRLNEIAEEREEMFDTIGVIGINEFNEFVEQYNADLLSDEEPMKRLPYIYLLTDDLEKLNSNNPTLFETILSKAENVGIKVLYPMIEKNLPVISFLKYAELISINSENLNKNEEIVDLFKREKSQSTADYYKDSFYEYLTSVRATTVMSAGSVNVDSQDSLYSEVLEFVETQRTVSTALLQRRFDIGYNRATRLLDDLENQGIIGPANGSKPREVYLYDDNNK